MKIGKFLAALIGAAPDTCARITEPIGEPPEDLLQLGNAAQQLLQDPVVDLALKRVQQQMVDRWTKSAMGNAAEREHAYLIYGAVEALRAELALMVANAAHAVATANLRQQQRDSNA